MHACFPFFPNRCVPQIPREVEFQDQFHINKSGLFVSPKLLRSLVTCSWLPLSRPFRIFKTSFYDSALQAFTTGFLMKIMGDVVLDILMVLLHLIYLHHT